MSTPTGAAYSIQDGPARRVVDITRTEGAALDRRAAVLGPAMEAGAAAAGPGSPIGAALGELHAAHDRLAGDNHRLIDSATTQASTAIAAYVAADGHMAQQYGPFPAVPGHPVLPDMLAELLRENGYAVPPPH